MSNSNETGGKKFDNNKPDLSLIPTDALWGTAAALTYGAKKYDRHNFRKGISYSRLVAATMRHLTAWNEGQELDLESGLSHLDHAMASLAMLKFMTVHKEEMDDRYITPENAPNSLTQESERLGINLTHDVLTEEIYQKALAIQARGR